MSSSETFKVKIPQRSSEAEEVEINRLIDSGFDDAPEDTVEKSPKKSKTPLYDKKDKVTKDFSVPLNAYYHYLLEEVAKGLSKQVGATIKRRPIAAGALKDYLDRQAEILGIKAP